MNFLVHVLLQSQQLRQRVNPCLNEANAGVWRSSGGEGEKMASPGQPLSNPLRSMQLLGPSPFMSAGWTTKDGHNVMHVRTAILPDPDGDEAQLELRQIDAVGGRGNQGRGLVGAASSRSYATVV